MAALVLVSCDRPEPFAPEPITVAPEELTKSFDFLDPIDPGQFLSVGTIGTAPDNGDVRMGGLLYRDIGITFDREMWVRVRTTGETSWAPIWDNFALCGGAFCSGGDKYPAWGYGSAGGAGVGQSGWMGVHVRVVKPDGGVTPWRRVNTPDGQREALMRVEPGWRLQARRDGLTGQPNCLGCPDPFAMGRIAGYTLAGYNDIVVEHVTPLQVRADRDVVGPGQEVTFNVLAYPGMRDLTWRYLREDRGEWLHPVECRQQTQSCTFVPPSDGRLNVYGRWGLLLVDIHAHSQRIRLMETKPELLVECGGPVVRGQEITCTARSSQEDVEVTVTGWRFEPDMVTIHPKVGPVEMADPVTEATSDTQWQGELVLPGTVTVRGRLGSNSEEDSASVPVRVSERNWNTGTGPAPQRVDPTWGDPPLVGASAVYGENVHVDENGSLVEGTHLLGLRFYQPLPAERIATVNRGPNRGYAYVRQFNIQLNRAYRVNKYITREHEVKDVRTRSGMQNRWRALEIQNWGNPEDFLQRTIQHETYGSGRIGHQDGLVQAVTGEVCGNLARRLERIAGARDQMDLQFLTAERAALEFLLVGSSHHRVYGHMQGARLVVREDGRVQPLLYEHHDHQRPLQPIEHRHICEYEAWGI